MMRRAIAVIGVAVCVGASSACAEYGPIGSSFKGKEPVKVYIGEMANESGQSQVTPETYKKDLEQGLRNRKSLTFQIVPTAAESDIQIAAVIKQYRYLERGPLKPSIGIQTTLLDAAASATHNYAEMTVDYTVTDTKTGKALWKNTINEYLKKVMTPGESIPMISDKVTRAFIARCFGKPNSPERARSLP